MLLFERSSTYIYKDKYWKTLKTQHLIQCQIIPDDQVCKVSDNEIDMPHQLACIRYKNQNILA